MNIRKLVQIAEQKESELSIALQNIEKELVFRDFQDETPDVTLCAGCEIILVYRGSEILLKMILYYRKKIRYEQRRRI